MSRANREALRKEVEQQTKEFLAKGGYIHVDNSDPIPPNHKANLRYLTGSITDLIRGGQS